MALCTLKSLSVNIESDSRAVTAYLMLGHLSRPKRRSDWQMWGTWRHVIGAARNILFVSLLYVYGIGSLGVGDCHFVSATKHGDRKRIRKKKKRPGWGILGKPGITASICHLLAMGLRASHLTLSVLSHQSEKRGRGRKGYDEQMKPCINTL